MPHKSIIFPAIIFIGQIIIWLVFPDNDNINNPLISFGLGVFLGAAIWNWTYNEINNENNDR